MICSALASAFSRAPASATKSNHVSKAPASTRCFIFPTTRATSILLRFSSAHSSRHVSNAIAMSRFLSLRIICSALASALARFSASATNSRHMSKAPESAAWRILPRQRSTTLRWRLSSTAASRHPQKAKSSVRKSSFRSTLLATSCCCLIVATRSSQPSKAAAMRALRRRPAMPRMTLYQCLHASA